MIHDTDRDTDTVFQLNNFKFMKDTDGDGDVDDDDDIPAAGDKVEILFPDNITYRINDKYIFTAANTDKLVTIRGKISSVDDDNPNLVTIEILFVDKDLEASRNPQNWTVELEKRPAIFESKFGRFAYRYQYEDNEDEIKIIELNPNDWNPKKVDLSLVNHAKEKGYLESIRYLLRDKQYDHNLCSAHLNADDWYNVCICDDCCQKFLDEHF